MTATYISADELFQEWRKDPEYLKEYDALKDEFTLAEAMIQRQEERMQRQVEEHVDASAKIPTEGR